MEEPDGAGSGHGEQPQGHRRPERRDQRHQRAAEEERGDAQNGHHRHRQGGGAQHHRYRDPPAHQPAADLHPGRGHPDPAGGRAEAPGCRGGAGPDRGRAQAEADGAALLRQPFFLSREKESKRAAYT